MHEYIVSLFPVDDGGYFLELRPADTTGTSPFVKFPRQDDLIRFFRGLRLSAELEEQVREIAGTLRSGTAYHHKMFLPTIAEQALLAVSGTPEESVPGLVALVSNSGEPI